MNKKTLESGKEYTLSNIFSGKNKILIPDLQRDYCWGDKAWDEDVEKHTELVSGFVDNLIDMFEKSPNDYLTLGLIYGYESPKSHIQLCDGQQRITTLYLLLGMLNRLSENKFIKLLISEKELHHDDKEPYLQYSIRESTLYFLSDLVCEFFLKKEVRVEDINSSKWYFSEYDQDASIQSMLAAIKTIEKKLSQKIDYERFGNFLANNLQMLYYDMGDRTRGEETFVIINTTGEPLTATENLKPILIGNIEDPKERKQFSKEWEDREEWFWKNRDGSGDTGNLVADYGVNEFFRWVTALKLNIENKEVFKEEISSVRESVTDFVKSKANDKNYLFELHKFFKLTKFLFENKGVLSAKKTWLAPNVKNKFINTQITWFQLLPVIAFLHRFGLDVEERKIIRVKVFFENLSRIDTVSKNVTDLIYDAIKLIREMPDNDIASVYEVQGISSQVLSVEEKLKFKIYLESEDRNKVEEIFWKSEGHPVWSGEILTLLEWSMVDDKFDLPTFEHYNNVFNKLFYDKMNYPELDVTRRALLTRNLTNYPHKFSGNTNYSFCWEYSDWQTLIKDNKQKIGIFLKELDVNKVDSQLLSMIESNNLEKDYDEFVKIPELLKFCEQKNIQWEDKKGWFLIKKKMRSGEYANLKAYRLYLNLKKDENCVWNSEQWKLLFYTKEGSCVVFENNSKNVVIDIRYMGSEKYQVQLFRRNIDAKNYKQQLSDIGQNLDLKWGEMNRYISGDLEEKDILVFLKKISDNNYNNL